MPQPIATWNTARDAWEVTGAKATPSLLCGHLPVYSETFPTSGTMRDGKVYAPQMWAPHTTASESSSTPQNALLPTPRTSDTNGPGIHGDGGLDLRTAVTLLPTPKASDGDFVTPSTSGRPASKATHLGTRVIKGIEAPGWGPYEPAIRRWENVTCTPSPPPTVPNSRGKHRLNPAFTEWMMGQPAGWITEVDISVNDQIKACGNGVVTQQALEALRRMEARREQEGGTYVSPGQAAVGEGLR